MTALVFLGLVAACGPGPGKPANVVVILVDTLRQDHVGCYGHDRNTTPAIDAFAGDAVKFERAYATSPWTTPTVASMFSGLYPGRHRVRTIDMALPGEVTTLAEILQQRGYATAGVVSHVLLDRRHRFDQGFAEYVEVIDQRRPHETVTTAEVTDAALQLLAGLEKQRDPFFMFVHYFDPHYEYLRHPQHRFRGQSRSGRLDRRPRRIHGPLRDLMRGLECHRDRPGLRDLYDEEIRHTDGGVGRLLQMLRESGRFDELRRPHAAELRELFLEGHACEQILDSALDGLGRIAIDVGHGGRSITSASRSPRGQERPTRKAIRTAGGAVSGIPAGSPAWAGCLRTSCRWRSPTAAAAEARRALG